MRCPAIVTLVALAGCARSTDLAPTVSPRATTPPATSSEPSPPATGTPPAAPPVSSALSAEAAALLAAHNAARARHCAPPLTWSPRLAAVAQAWADHLRADRCAFEHSDSPFGENLAAGTDGALDADAVVAMWVDERSAYDFARGGFSMATGHFTQVVWRDTRELGCGSARCAGMTLWVCNYDPPGNVDGGYRANVRPGC